MPPIMIFYLIIFVCSAIPIIFVFITLFFTPWFINHKFRGELKERLQKKTGFSTSDFFKYGTFNRTMSYAWAALSEKSARKYFEVSSEVFRSKLNRFEIFLCYIAVISVPFLFFMMGIVFIADWLGYLPPSP